MTFNVTKFTEIAQKHEDNSEDFSMNDFLLKARTHSGKNISSAFQSTLEFGIFIA